MRSRAVALNTGSSWSRKNACGQLWSNREAADIGWATVPLSRLHAELAREERAHGGAVEGERHVHVGARAEDDQPDPVARATAHELGGAALRRGEPR